MPKTITLPDLDTRLLRLEQMMDSHGVTDRDMVALNVKRNVSTSRLCQLPDELLVQIVKLAEDRSGSDVHDDLRHQPEQSPMMRVCTRLRTLICHTPTFWTRLDTSWGPERIKLHLNRSDNCALRVILHVTQSTDLSFARSLLSRCAEATINVGASSSDVTPHILALPAPMAQHITVALGGGHKDSVRYPFNDRFLGQQCAQLTELRLEGVCIESIPYFPRLTLLDIRSSTLGPLREHSFAASLERSTPNLTKLVLTRIVLSAPPTHDDFIDVGQASLPFLEELYIEGDDAAVVWMVLQDMALPQKRLEIHAHCSEGPSILASAALRANIVDYVHRFWNRARPGDTPLQFELEAWQYDASPSLGWAVHIREPMRIASGSNCVRVSLASNTDLSAAERFLGKVHRLRLHVRAVEGVCLDPHAWPAADALPQLEEMVLRTPDVRPSVAALEAWANRRVSLGHSPVRVALYMSI
jgi:hypothetical protein